MMDRTALLHRAAEVRRRIFASLPWEVRLACVFTQLASELGLITPWGKLLGQYFLDAKIEGMPPTGPNYKPESRDPARTLPNGYMAKFVGDVYGLLVKKYHNPYLAQEAIQDYLAKLAEGKVKLKPVPLSSAESFVRHGIVLEAMGKARLELRDSLRNERLEDTDEDSKSVSREIEDPAAEKGFRDRLPPRVFHDWMEYLKKTVHPDIEIYFQKKMEGFNDKEIVGDPRKNIPSMLPHYKATPQNWEWRYKDKFYEKSKDFFKSRGLLEGDLTPADLAALYSESAPPV